MNPKHVVLQLADRLEADALRRAAAAENRSNKDAWPEIAGIGDDLRRVETVRSTVARVTRDEPVYRADAERGDPDFLRDVVVASGRLHTSPTGPAEARARLERHNLQVRDEHPEYRSYDGAAFLPPSFWFENPVTIARARRPAADFYHSDSDLPKGGELRLPRITTGATGTFGSQDFVTAEGTFSVIRVAPSWTSFSQQVVDQGGPLSNAAIYAEMRGAWAAELDRQLLHGAGGTTQLGGLLGVTGNTDVTYTDATPTAAEFYSKLASAVASAALVGAMEPTGIVMHSRRWTWFEYAAATEKLTCTILPPRDGDTDGTVARLFGGCPVIVDNNVATGLGAGTNEDAVFVAHRDAAVLLEAPPVLEVDPIVDVSVENLLVRAKLRSYAVLLPRYPSAIVNITGTGLITPTFP